MIFTMEPQREVIPGPKNVIFIQFIYSNVRRDELKRFQTEQVLKDQHFLCCVFEAFAFSNIKKKTL